MYLLKLGELFISFADFPFILAFNDLNDILSVRFLTILRLFNDILTHCYVKGLFVRVGD